MASNPSGTTRRHSGHAGIRKPVPSPHDASLLPGAYDRSSCLWPEAGGRHAGLVGERAIAHRSVAAGSRKLPLGLGDAPRDRRVAPRTLREDRRHPHRERKSRCENDCNRLGGSQGCLPRWSNDRGCRRRPHGRNCGGEVHPRRARSLREGGRMLSSPESPRTNTYGVRGSITPASGTIPDGVLACHAGHADTA